MDPLAALPWHSKGPLVQIGNGEKLLRRSHGHWVRFALPVFVALVLGGVGVSFFIAAYSAADAAVGGTLLLAALLVTLAVVHWFFHLILSESVSDIFLTNKRILHFSHRLWFFDGVEETVLARIKVVEVQRRGILKQILNYGNIEFDTSAGKGLTFIPDPKGWAEDIERQIR